MISEIMVTIHYEFPDFVAAEQPWPNPVDNRIWGNMSIMKEMNESDKSVECERLEAALFDVWAGVEQSVIGDGIGQWRRCIRETGHFDYSLWHILVKTLLTVIN